MTSLEYVRDSVFNHKYSFESDVIDIKNYFSNYKKLLHNVDLCQDGECKDLKDKTSSCQKESCKNNTFFTSLLGISQQELQELTKRTSVDHLTCEGEIKPVDLNLGCRSKDEFPESASAEVQKKTPNSLVSVRKRAELSEVNKISFSRRYFKYNNYEWCMATSKPARRKIDYSVEDFSNIVACVKIYCPFLSLLNKNSKFKLLQEIHILGNQTLAELKDKITCALDYVGDTDMSHDCFLKNVGVDVTAKDVYPSSFIFIENTFYIDSRKPNHIDLSEEIREWGSKRSLGPFETAKMERTKICDLKLKVGSPYVFQHQGNCEHILVFSDIRFLELSDPAVLSSFPRTHCIGRVYGKHCMMCTDFYARWLVIGNERLTHDKAYLCNKCFKSYNYIKNKKIGQFQAYKYVDPVALL